MYRKKYPDSIPCPDCAPCEKCGNMVHKVGHLSLHAPTCPVRVEAVEALLKGVSACSSESQD